MADYCTTADVVRELPHVKIDVTTKPSADEVTQFCADITADMDARFRAVGLEVPITAADPLKVVKPIAANGVKAKVLRSKQLGDQPQTVDYEKLYQDAMARIERNPSIVQAQDAYGQPEGTEREDEDIKFRRTEDDW